MLHLRPWNYFLKEDRMRRLQFFFLHYAKLNNYYGATGGTTLTHNSFIQQGKGEELHELTKKAMVLQAGYNTKDVIESASPFIGEEFRETLFAMVCEVMLLDGTIDDDRTAVVAMLALHLGISMERMKMILATYLIRNKWNVQVVAR